MPKPPNRNGLGLDERNAPTHNHSIVHLGHIVTTPGQDDEGEELTAAVLSDNYSVDVRGRHYTVKWTVRNDRRAYVRTSAIAEWTASAKNYIRSIYRTT